ncbi:hypothetical protein BHE74_00013375, partial [Ensete ventricosum]
MGFCVIMRMVFGSYGTTGIMPNFATTGLHLAPWFIRSCCMLMITFALRQQPKGNPGFQGPEPGSSFLREIASLSFKLNVHSFEYFHRDCNWVADKAANFGRTTVRFRTAWYIPVRQLTGMQTARYRVVPPKSIVDSRFQTSVVDFSHQQSIDGEIDRRRSIEGEKGKKKKKRKRRKKKKRIHTSFPRAVLARVPSPPTRRPRLRIACVPSSPASILLPREETKHLPARGERSRRRHKFLF